MRLFTLTRRGFFGAATLLFGALEAPGAFLSAKQAPRTRPMTRFGLHGTLIAHPGQRDALAQLLLEDTQAGDALPGCELYMVSIDEKDDTAVHVTEVWRSEADHKASLQRPDVRAMIEKGRPMIAGFGGSTRLTVLGGLGLDSPGLGPDSQD